MKRIALPLLHFAEDCLTSNPATDIDVDPRHIHTDPPVVVVAAAAIAAVVVAAGIAAASIAAVVVAAVVIVGG